MSTTPPGWYDDGHGALRWWDGAQWTEHVQPAQQPPAPAPGVTPSGYPGQGFSPAVAPGEKPKSKLWILWVVLGGIVVLFAVAAALIIPIIVGWFAAGSTEGPNLGTGESDAAAIAAVELYDDAWDDADCSAYEDSTTPTYRESIGITDCATFETEAAYFDETTDEYDMTVTALRTLDDGSVEVRTRETYLSLADDDGTPLAEPERVADALRYVVVEEDGLWRIDELGADE